MRVTPVINTVKKIGNNEFKAISNSYQIAHNCYMISSLHALNNSRFGRVLLSKSIHLAQREDGKTFFEFLFRGVRPPNKILVDDNINYKKIRWRKNIDIAAALEYATDRIIKKHPSLKPLCARIIFAFSKRCEYNKSSNFMKMLTGIEPVQLGDNSLLKLRWRKKKALKLMEQIANTPRENMSFVAGTIFSGCERGLADNHYYSLAKIDMEAKKVYLGNPRAPKNLKEIRFKTFFNNFRSITGYFKETAGY